MLFGVGACSSDSAVLVVDGRAGNNVEAGRREGTRLHRIITGDVFILGGGKVGLH